MKTLQDIISGISLESQQLMKRVSANALNLQWIEHSHALWSAKILTYAKTLPAGRLKNRLVEIGGFVALHPEMCYANFIDYFDNVRGWANDMDFRNGILDCFKDEPYVLKLYTKNDPKLSK